MKLWRICPARDVGVALVMREASIEAMLALLLQELSTSLPSDRHAVLIMDRAGWRTAHRLIRPANITPLHLPVYSSQLVPSCGSGCTCASDTFPPAVRHPKTPSWTPAAPPETRFLQTQAGWPASAAIRDGHNLKEAL